MTTVRRRPTTPTGLALRRDERSKEGTDHGTMDWYAENHGDLRGEPENDQRDEMFQVFEKRLAATPKDGSKALALLKAVKVWEDKAVKAGSYSGWRTFSGVPAWKRPFEYSCVLGAASDLLYKRNVKFNAATLTWLTPYLGDALLAVSLEGWFHPHFRVLGLGEFAKDCAAGVVDGVLEADKKRSARLEEKAAAFRKSGRKPKTRQHRPAKKAKK